MATQKKELTVEEKLKALYDLQQKLSEIDAIKTLRGELPQEVQDLEDEIAGLHTRVTKFEDEVAVQQDEMARDILKDPMATQEQKDRANGVLKATQKYYDNKGFQRGYAKDKNGKVITEYYGIKTLQLLTHEETVRNNKINEELQRQQVEAAKSQAGAAWASANNAKNEYNLRIKQTNAALVTDMFNAVAAGQATYDEKTGIVSGYQGANWKVTGKGDLKNQNAVKISG